MCQDSQERQNTVCKYYCTTTANISLHLDSQNAAALRNRDMRRSQFECLITATCTRRVPEDGKLLRVASLYY